MEETKMTSIHNGGISLFNRIGGIKRLCFGNSQIAPSSAWKEMFCCTPSSLNPISGQINMVMKFYGFNILPRQLGKQGVRRILDGLYFFDGLVIQIGCKADWRN